MALKLPSPAQAFAFLVYLIPFAVFFVAALSATHANLAVAGDGAVKTYASVVTAMAGGFAVFLAAQYIHAVHRRPAAHAQNSR